MKILLCLNIIAATYQVTSPKEQNGLSLFYHDLLQILREMRTYETGDFQYKGLKKEQVASFRNVLRITSSLCLTQSTPNFDFLNFIDFNLCNLNSQEKEALFSFKLFDNLTRKVMSGKITHRTLHKEFMSKTGEIIRKIKTSELLIEKDVFNVIHEEKFTYIHLSWNVIVPSLMCHSKDMNLSYNDYVLYANVINGSIIKNAFNKVQNEPGKILTPSDYELNGLKFIDHKDRYIFKYNFSENLEDLKLTNIICSIDIVDSFLRVFNLICKSYQIFLKIKITYEDQLYMANIRVKKVSKEPTILNIKIRNEISTIGRSSSYRSIRKEKITVIRAKTPFFDYIRKSPIIDRKPRSAKSSVDLNNSSNPSSPHRSSRNSTSNNYNSPVSGNIHSPGSSLSPYKSSTNNASNNYNSPVSGNIYSPGSSLSPHQSDMNNASNNYNSPVSGNIHSPDSSLSPYQSSRNDVSNNYNSPVSGNIYSPGSSLSPHQSGMNNTSNNYNSPIRGVLNNSAHSNSPISSGCDSPVRGFPNSDNSKDDETVSCHNFLSFRSRSSFSLNKSSSRSTASLNRSDSKVSLNSSRDKKKFKPQASPNNDLLSIDDISIHSIIMLTNIFMSFNKKAVVLNIDNVFVEMFAPKNSKKIDDFEIGRFYDLFNYRYNESDVTQKVLIINDFTQKIVEASENSYLKDFLYFITMSNDGNDIKNKITFKEYIKIVGLTKIAIRFLDWHHLPIHEDTLDKILSNLKNKKKDLDKELANYKKFKANLEKTTIKEDEEFPYSIPYIQPGDSYFPFYVYMNLLRRTKLFLNEKRLYEILEESLIYLMYKKLITDKYKFTKTYKCLISLLNTLFELLIFKIDFAIFFLDENVFSLMPNSTNTFNDQINLVDIFKDFNSNDFSKSKDDVYTVFRYSIKKRDIGKYKKIPFIVKQSDSPTTIFIPENVINDIYDNTILSWLERFDNFLFESLKIN